MSGENNQAENQQALEQQTRDLIQLVLRSPEQQINEQQHTDKNNTFLQRHLQLILEEEDDPLERLAGETLPRRKEILRASDCARSLANLPEVRRLAGDTEIKTPPASFTLLIADLIHEQNPDNASRLVDKYFDKKENMSEEEKGYLTSLVDALFDRSPSLEPIFKAVLQSDGNQNASDLSDDQKLRILRQLLKQRQVQLNIAEGLKTLLTPENMEALPDPQAIEQINQKEQKIKEKIGNLEELNSTIERELLDLQQTLLSSSTQTKLSPEQIKKRLIKLRGKERQLKERAEILRRAVASQKKTISIRASEETERSTDQQKARTIIRETSTYTDINNKVEAQLNQTYEQLGEVQEMIRQLTSPPDEQLQLRLQALQTQIAHNRSLLEDYQRQLDELNNRRQELLAGSNPDKIFDFVNELTHIPVNAIGSFILETILAARARYVQDTISTIQTNPLFKYFEKEDNSGEIDKNKAKEIFSDLVERGVDKVFDTLVENIDGQDNLKQTLKILNDQFSNHPMVRDLKKRIALQALDFYLASHGPNRFMHFIQSISGWGGKRINPEHIRSLANLDREALIQIADRNPWFKKQLIQAGIITQPFNYIKAGVRIIAIFFLIEILLRTFTPLSLIDYLVSITPFNNTK